MSSPSLSLYSLELYNQLSVLKIVNFNMVAAPGSYDGKLNSSSNPGAIQLQEVRSMAQMEVPI